MQIHRFSLAAAALAAGVASAFAQSRPVELPGAKDPALISRYAGSVLQNAAIESFASVRVPAGPGQFGSGDKLVFDKVTTVEGSVGAYFYIAPKERGALEVFRNYQAALAQGGFMTLYSCEMRVCDQALIREPFSGEVLRARRWAADRINPSGSISRDIR